MSETFTERTAGIWFPLIFYAVGGIYMLAVWGIFDKLAFHLMALGILSIIVAVSLYMLSRWGFLLGLLAFPLFLVEFFYALITSINLVGWNPNLSIALLNASFVVYLIFLVFSVVFLIDKRNALKSDRLLDLMRGPIQTIEKSEKPKT
jgi:uncharacterized membrane protein (DUF2068 family)